MYVLGTPAHGQKCVVLFAVLFLGVLDSPFKDGVDLT